MRRWILGLLFFTVGLLLGQLSARPVGKVAEPTPMPKYYLKLKGLYGLAKDFEAVKGSLPESMEVLQAWCKEDNVRNMLFQETEILQARPQAGIHSWIIAPASYQGDQSNFYIRSGGVYFRNNLPFELGVDRQGTISYRRP